VRTTRLPETIARLKTRAARAAVIAVLAALCVLGALGFPGRGGILASIRAEAAVVTLTGIVKGAPRGAPLPGALVFSDKEVCLTDAHGFFRLNSGKGSCLRFEAQGYATLRLTTENERPLTILLFPEAPHAAD
jgi:hypothetical protein